MNRDRNAAIAAAKARHPAGTARDPITTAQAFDCEVRMTTPISRVTLFHIRLLLIALLVAVVAVVALMLVQGIGQHNAESCVAYA